MKCLWFALAILPWLLAACGVSPTSEAITSTPTTSPTATLTPAATPAHTPTATSTPAIAPAAIAVPLEVTAWLTTNAVPFDTPLPGHGCDDLRPLLAMIGDARIVALGEATHGTSEFFTMKHRILECLVQESGFSILALENTDPDLARINAYLQTGEGHLDAALGAWAQHLWMGTREVADLLTWIHSHNQRPGRAPRVSLRGFDATFSPGAFESVLNYVSTVDPGRRQRVWDDLECFRQAMSAPEAYAHADAEMLSRCAQGVAAVHDLLAVQERAYRKVSSPEAYNAAVSAARSLVQNEALLRFVGAADNLEAMNLRDQFMAENVAWLLAQAGPDAKIVLWAHNGHVQTTSVFLPWLDSQSSSPEEADRAFKPMGMYLREWFGEELVVIGFSFESGSFRAFRGSGMGLPISTEIMELTVQPPLPDSHETYLYTVGRERYTLDLRALPAEGVVAEWFAEPRYLRTIGFLYDENDPVFSSYFLRLPEAFDIVIAFRETTASRAR